MNKLWFLLLLIATQNLIAQNFYLKIEGSSIKETHIIDSLDYNKQHASVASILEEQKSFENKLLASGFFSKQLLEQKKTNDSSFVFRYKLNKPIRAVIVQTNSLTIDEKELLAIDKDSVSILPSEIESWMQLKLALLEKKGYALAKLQLINQKNKDLYIYSDLKLSLNIKRQVNDLVILGYDKFPKNIKQNWLRKLRNRTFNQEIVNEVSSDIENFPFVTQTRSPEILFTKDSTKIYTYLEKTKP